MSNDAFGQAMSCTQTADGTVDKWEALSELTIAAQAYDLSHTTLTVLRALLTFLPTRTISLHLHEAIVFPSNKTLSKRLNGMPESTLRRHLGLLVASGIVSRHDSGNRKRFARNMGQGVRIAFGFDLGPIAYQMADLRNAANVARAEAQEIAAIRCKIGHLRTQLATQALLETTRKMLRRKLDVAALEAIHDMLVEAINADDLIGSDNENERHIQSDSKTITVSQNIDSKKTTSQNNHSLGEALSRCKEYKSFFPEPIRDWQDLLEIAYRLTTMIGIDRQVFEQTVQRLGAQTASVAVICILENLDHIQNPGGYLRTLASQSGHRDLDLSRVLGKGRAHGGYCQLTT